jgi:hypothetical protein
MQPSARGKKEKKEPASLACFSQSLARTRTTIHILVDWIRLYAQTQRAKLISICRALVI